MTPQDVDTHKHALPCSLHSHPTGHLPYPRQLVKRAITTPRQATQFLEALWRDPAEALVVLASDDGHARIDEILAADFRAAPVSEREFSFLAGPLSLARLAIDSRFTHTPMESQVCGIYAHVHANALFLRNALECLRALAEVDPIAFSLGEASEWERVGGLLGAVATLASLVRAIIMRLPDALASRHINEFVTGLAQLEARAVHRGKGSGRDAPRGSDHLRWLLAALQRAQPPPPDDAQPSDSGPPQRPPGGRHDNDKTNFRDIRTAPTQDEVLCIDAPYLTRAYQVPPDANALLEHHVRLLRHDMLAAYQRAVCAWLARPIGPKGGASGRVKVTCDIAGRPGGTPREGDASVHVLRHACFERMGFGLDGAIACVSVRQLGFLSREKDDNKRAEAWAAYGPQVDSLVCVALGVTLARGDGAPRAHNLAAARLVFAVVAHPPRRTKEEEQPDALEPNRCHVWLKLLSAEDITAVARIGQRAVGEDVQGVEDVLILVHGHFYVGYSPVIAALQDPKRPLYPMVETLAEAATPHSDASQPPAFLPPGTTVDVSPLLAKGHPKAGNALIKFGDFGEVRAALRAFALQGDMLADGTQLDAIAAMLTRRVALVQGPPGTGKTHVGVLVARILAKRGITPIVCMCFTNHALDQFLEAIADGGIVSLEDTVRVGGRSRNEKLQARSLHKLRIGNLTQYAYRAKKELQAAKEDVEKLLVDALRRATRPTSEWKDIADTLRVLYPDIADEFEVGEDGYAFQGRVKDAWSQWVQGSPRATDTRGHQREHVETLNRFDALGTGAAAVEHRRAGRIVVQEASPSRSAWTLSRVERRRVVDACMRLVREVATDELRGALRKHESLCARIAEISLSSDLRVLQGAKVVGMTTSGCARHGALLRALGARVLICEEAGEVLEAQILAALTEHNDQLILIGDHKQLRPKVAEHALTVASGGAYDLDLSTFERLVRIVEDRAKRNDARGGSSAALRAQGLQYVTLDQQYRMRPEIASLVRETIYRQLKDAPEVHSREDVRGFAMNVVFLDHDQPESTDTGPAIRSCRSHANAWEADFAVQMARFLVRQGYKPHEIAILVTYTGQLLLVRDRLRAQRMLVHLSDGDRDDLRETLDGDLGDGDDSSTGDEMSGEGRVESVALSDRVRLSTVDNFQGEEARVVVLSLVRCNATGKIGFLKDDNRANVALSRARDGLVIIGSARTLETRAGTPLFKRVVSMLRTRGAVVRALPLRCSRHGEDIHVASPGEFDAKCPDGGCARPCEMRLDPCGHLCRRKCHPDNPKHYAAGVCLEECARVYEACGHRCPKRCGEPCNPACYKRVDRVLPCGHMYKNAVCGEDTRTLKCKEMVTVPTNFPLCGHAGRLPCPRARHLAGLVDLIERGEEWVTLQYDRNVEAIFACGEPCGKSRAVCGHTCTGRCGECTRTATEKVGKLTRPGAVDGHHAGTCTVHCTRQYGLCGHACSGASCHTATECPPCAADCRAACEHSKCAKRCRDVCAPCAEPCRWACGRSHTDGRLECELPCGVPCVRPPCDRRCGLPIPGCGHACPCACGERCATPAHCIECARAGAEGTDGAQVIDLLSFTTLADADPEGPPLVVLACGHAFTTETLDAQLSLDKVYARNAEGQWAAHTSTRWSSTEATGADLDDLVRRATCPHCRAPIAGARRYGRILKAIEARRNAVALLLSTQADAADMERTAAEVESSSPAASQITADDLEKAAASAKKRAKDCEKAAAATTSNAALCFQASAVLLRAGVRCLAAAITLSARAAEAEQARRQRADRVIRDEAAQRREDRAITAGERAVLALYTNCQRLIERQADASRKAGAALDGERGALAAAQAHLAFAHASMRLTNLATRQEEAVRRGRESLERVRSAQFAEAKVQLTRALGRLQTTPEEMRMVFEAMRAEVSTVVNGFGGNWKTCPNGHPYVVGECGGAMEEGHCASCGAAIGGRNHGLAAGNVDIAEGFLRTVGVTDSLVRRWVR